MKASHFHSLEDIQINVMTVGRNERAFWKLYPAILEVMKQALKRLWTSNLKVARLSESYWPYLHIREETVY
jgi:hypothetical protein